MASISAVKIALERGNTDDALYLLRKVLKTKPSAEAFYLAGKLAPNAMMAKKYLAQALRLQPDYEPAVVLLQVVERREQRQTDQLRTDLLEAISVEPEDTFNPGVTDTPGGILTRLMAAVK